MSDCSVISKLEETYVTGYFDRHIEIREVWQNNLQDEMMNIQTIARDFPYVSMDTEFPGTVFKDDNISRYSYEAVRANVNETKLIQLGLTFSTPFGLLPTFGSPKFVVWQFNFREFDPEKDPCNPDSIQLLRRSGIDFQKNMAQGVDISEFKHLLVTSGLLMNGHTRWITFHGASDFGYLLKMITGTSLPENQRNFRDLIRCFFPVRYDVKHLYSNTEHRDLGLNRIAAIEGCIRVGAAHLAGSDSLLTLLVFMRKKKRYQDQGPGVLDSYAGVVFGI